MSHSVDFDEVAHYEPPHQHLGCLQIQLFLSVVLQELTLLHSQQPVLAVLSAIGLKDIQLI